MFKTKHIPLHFNNLTHKKDVKNLLKNVSNVFKKNEKY